jgi:hypothetical protein
MTIFVIKKESMKVNTYRLILTTAAALLLLLAGGYTGENKTARPVEPAQGEEINWQVISSGGTKGASTNFQLSGTVGQTVVGVGSSTNFRLSHGFWQEFGPPSCCNGDGIRGDVDMGGSMNVADVTYLVAYLKGLGPAPPCTEEANANGDVNESVNVTDVTYLVAYLKGLGPQPPACP